MLAEDTLPSTQTSAESLEDVQLPDQLAKLSACIDASPEVLATGSKDLQVAALQAAKYVFDLALQSESKSRAVITELLSSLSPSMAPQTRSQAASLQAKAGAVPEVKAPVLEETPLPELCVDGMDKEQIWAQLELRNKTVTEILEFALESTGELPESDDGQAEGSLMKRHNGLTGDDDEDEDEDMDFDDENEDEDQDDSDEDEDEDQDDTDEEEEDGEEGDMDLGENVTTLRDSSDDREDQDEDEDGMALDASGPRRPSRRKGKGHPELDDGFFDLATFNAQTEAAEARNVSRGRLDDDDDDEEDWEDEINLFASVDGVEDEDDATSESLLPPFMLRIRRLAVITSELYYKDFFAPPSRKAIKSQRHQSAACSSSEPIQTAVRFSDEVRVKKIKAKGKNLPVSTTFDLISEEDNEDEEFGEKMVDSEDDDESEDEESQQDSGSDDEESGDEGQQVLKEEDAEGSEEGWDTRETIERFRDDLFADEETEEDTDLSAHEKRLAAIKEEIAALEAENVEAKHWTLMGEATSRSRPQNALLEEDLEFDRVMKSVPVITEEVVHSLEERIKARILDNRFDDVVRKRPVDDKPFLPSRLLDLQDTKSKQSLAEIYEDDYMASKTGGVAGEDRDGKLKKEHEEIEKIWEALCAKIDALSNAHFTPKAPKASISTVSNIASATLESALPTTKATSTMLAPEEVFTTSASDLRAKSELTPAEKRALHNKQKKAKRKARDLLEKSVDQFARMKGRQSVNKQKEVALKNVVKSGKGVTVIGKKNQDLLKDGGKKART
ncbi:hypothetical protein NM688_g5303 [Phlebia brevispora]|uniref:Uncharacterized protein n=1 Tax=Phlebia brevispora TaxID=194682 RepID=A0ACC1SXP3_9APHY|nr:hypothetical protein NM688_g5303 [Phlebia brevispora]